MFVVDPVKEAIDSSRIHLEGDTVYFEPGISIPVDNMPKHISFQAFEEKNLFFGGVNAVTSQDGCSDIRRDGTCRII